MSVLVGQKLAKSYGANEVFANVDVRIEHGDRIGLVGVNGSGKTSLLRVLAGLEPATAGTIQMAQGLRIGFLPQDAPPLGDRVLFDDLVSVFQDLLDWRDDLRRLEQRMTEPGHSEAELAQILAEYGEKQQAFEEAGGYTIEHRVKSVLTGLGFDEALWHEPMAHLSGGQRTRALLGRLLLEEPDLLLLDEPTNHLDVNSVEWLEQQLVNWKGCLVVVSHDRYFLDTVATRVWELFQHRLEAYRGNYSQYRSQRAQRLAYWESEYEKQQKFIQETQDFIRRYKAGQRSKEARGRETRLQRFLEREALPPPPKIQHIRLPFQSDRRSGDLVLRAHKLVVGYTGPTSEAGNGAQTGAAAAHTPILTVPDLELRRGRIAALIGPNGAGKTTLVRTILGELPPLAGAVQMGAGVEIGYLPQYHVGAGYGLMDPQQTVLDSLLEIRNLPLAQARNYLAQFLFRGDDVFKPVESLSGGQRSRLALARLTLQGANFLLLDEPTNHLDLDSQEILQEALQQFTGTILLVTHDRALVDALATELWMVTPGNPGHLERFNGTWRQWLDERARRAELAADPAVLKQADKALPDAKMLWEKQRDERRIRQRAEKHAAQMGDIEERIHSMEARLAQLEEAMAEASLAQDFTKVHALNEQHQALTQRLEQLWEQWVSLSDKVESY
jgi:ATP-binding cassette subfamily F protein 3